MTYIRFGEKSQKLGSIWVAQNKKFWCKKVASLLKKLKSGARHDMKHNETKSITFRTIMLV